VDTLRSKLLVTVVGFAALALGSTLVAGALGSAGRTYVSARYHYSLPVPAGLELAPAKADQLYGFFPGARSPEVDFFGAGPANNPKGIGVASVALPAGMTLEGWEQANVREIAHDWHCSAPKRTATSLDGAPAVELVYPSCDGNLDAIEVVHGGRGYDVYWFGPAETRSQDQARFHADIKGFRFTS
jgi:hypothetical protein